MRKQRKPDKMIEMIIRYPGSKAKLHRRIVRMLNGKSPCDAECGPLYSSARQLVYCEPFFGSGAIGWRVMRGLPSRCTAVINDADPGMAALWSAVRDSPAELIGMVTAFRPTADAFFRFKERDGKEGIDPVVRGFEKLALHQMSFSGLGYKAGGPLGGKSGRTEYNPECRWRPGKIAHGIRRCHVHLTRLNAQVHNEDFERTLSRLHGNVIAYLDPPYFVQGPSLYKHAMTENDHVRLSQALRSASYSWVLSYDDCPDIRDLYSWAEITSFEMVPTIQTSRGPTRRKNSELLITPKGQS